MPTVHDQEVAMPTLTTAPSGAYAFGTDDDGGTRGPVVVIVQSTDRGWRKARDFYASDVADLGAGTQLALDLLGGWLLDEADTAALSAFAREALGA